MSRSSEKNFRKVFEIPVGQLAHSLAHILQFPRTTRYSALIVNLPFLSAPREKCYVTRCALKKLEARSELK